MTRNWIAPSLFALAAVLLAVTISDYRHSFQDGEVTMNYFDVFTVNGERINYRDLKLIRNADGDVRPRYISIFADLVALKTRIALWKILPPHPSFSPFWFITIGLGGLLLYRFLTLVLGDRPAALVGTAVYLVSPGVVSSVMMFFHQGKPLSMVVVIIALILSERLRQLRKAMPSTMANNLWAYPLPLLLTFGGVLAASPFVDDTAVFAFFAPLAWCPYFFFPRNVTREQVVACVRNWASFALPVLAIVLIFIIALPATREQPSLSAWLIANSGERFSFAYVIWTAYNLICTQIIPGAYLGVDAPVRWRIAYLNDLQFSPQMLFLCITFLAATSIAVWRHSSLRSPFIRTIALAAMFVMFQALAFLLHGSLLVASGFYYGSIFSVLGATYAAIVYLALWRSPIRYSKWIGSSVIALIFTASTLNVRQLGESWQSHSHWKLVEMSSFIPKYEGFGSFEEIYRLKARYNLTSGFYIDAPGEQERFGLSSEFTRCLAIWNRWRDGRHPLGGAQAIVHVSDLWLMRELVGNLPPPYLQKNNVLKYLK